LLDVHIKLGDRSGRNSRTIEQSNYEYRSKIIWNKEKGISDLVGVHNFSCVLIFVNVQTLKFLSLKLGGQRPQLYGTPPLVARLRRVNHRRCQRQVNILVGIYYNAGQASRLSNTP